MIKGANERKTKMIVYPDDFKPDRDNEGYGVAFDVGTTTIVGILWDMKYGVQKSICARTNPQNEFGMDVISRITFCMDKSSNIQLMRQKTIDCLNEMIGELCHRENITCDKILKVNVCGNTTMSHIFAGYSPVSLAVSPFVAQYTGTLNLSADESELKISKYGSVTVVPNIAGHVGGDITAGLVATRILQYKEPTLFIDIGTNGEIVLTDGNRIVACSTAAGPAFEGAGIKYGMRAAEGAIEKAMISENGILIKTIGNKPPQGICGSGLVDIIAVLLDCGLMSEKGRLKQDENGNRTVMLAQNEDGSEVLLTQHDIREVQLAKAAILAGVRVMLKELNKTEDDIKRVLVAGAFGNYVDKVNAVKIGLLPHVDHEKIKFMGNTAGAGASMMLMSDKEMLLAEQIVEKTEHIELAKVKTFQREYLDAMSF